MPQLQSNQPHSIAAMQTISPTQSAWTHGYESGLINHWIESNGFYYSATTETLIRERLTNPHPAGSDQHREWAGAEVMGREDAGRLAW